MASSDRFSQEFKDALTEWVIHVNKFIGLQDWSIDLLPDPPEGDDAAASIDAVYGRRWADLRLASDFFDFDRRHQEHYLLHELCHLVVNPIDDVIEHSGLQTIIGMPAWTIFNCSATTAIENVVDAMALAVADLFADGETYVQLLDALMEAECLPVADQT